MRGPRSTGQLFDEAIEKRRLSTAWIRAHEMGHVSLDRALRLTILAGEVEDPKYPRLARRFLIAFIREQNPSLSQVVRLADALNSIDDFLDIPGGPRASLRDLADRLARLDRP